MSDDEHLMPQALYSIESEKAVLGCMLLMPHEVIEQAAVLVKGDFFVPAHQEIFSVLAQMHNAGLPIDPGLVHQQLADRKMAEAVGSPGILADLLMGFATHLNVDAYIKIVKDKSLLRSLQAVCYRIIQNIVDGPDAVSEVLNDAEGLIFAVTEMRRTGSSPILTSAEAVTQFRELRHQLETGITEARIKTGFSTIDAGNGGLPHPSYCCIAGAQSSGKSALMLQLLKQFCYNGYAVGMFSMEMTVEQLIARQVADFAPIDSRRLNGKIHPGEQAAVEKALDLIATMPYYIDPRANLRPNDITSGVRRFVKLGCKIIFLDNLQLAAGDDDRDNRVRQLTGLSRTIQGLYREYNILFILVAQIKRSAKEKGDLKAWDVADCSAIENDSRVMLMLEEGPGAKDAPASAFPLQLKVVKYSEGETGDFPVIFNKKEQRMFEPQGKPAFEVSPFLPI